MIQPFVHPYGIELVGDGIDQNCDGEDTDRMIDSSVEVGCSILPTGKLSCYSENSITILKMFQKVYIPMSKPEIDMHML